MDTNAQPPAPAAKDPKKEKKELASKKRQKMRKK